MATDGNHYKWLVTGGAGFFGVHMCRGLIQRNEHVISYDTAVFPPEEHIEGLTTIVGDIRDTDKLRTQLKGVDFVIHAAAALCARGPFGNSICQCGRHQIGAGSGRERRREAGCLYWYHGGLRHA